MTGPSRCGGGGCLARCPGRSSPDPRPLPRVAMSQARPWRGPTTSLASAWATACAASRGRWARPRRGTPPARCPVWLPPTTTPSSPTSARPSWRSPPVILTPLLPYSLPTLLPYLLLPLFPYSPPPCLPACLPACLLACLPPHPYVFGLPYLPGRARRMRRAAGHRRIGGGQGPRHGGQRRAVGSHGGTGLRSRRRGCRGRRRSQGPRASRARLSRCV